VSTKLNPQRLRIADDEPPGDDSRYKPDYRPTYLVDLHASGWARLRIVLPNRCAPGLPAAGTRYWVDFGQVRSLAEGAVEALILEHRSYHDATFTASYFHKRLDYLLQMVEEEY